jgi:ketosteroid isomerase-like protein
MPDPNVALIRQAYAAYACGHTAAMPDLVDPDLEWTYLDPSAADPCPQVCNGRGELAAAPAQQAERGLPASKRERNSESGTPCGDGEGPARASVRFSTSRRQRFPGFMLRPNRSRSATVNSL